MTPVALYSVSYGVHTLQLCQGSSCESLERRKSASALFLHSVLSTVPVGGFREQDGGAVASGIERVGCS